MTMSQIRTRDYGLFRVACGVPVVHLGDPDANADEIIKLVLEARKHNIQLLATPELSLTGYTCEDLFLREILLDAANSALKKVLGQTKDTVLITIVGMPLAVNGLLFNVAVVMKGGKILGVVPKTYLPNYSEFYERRWFASADQLPVKEIELLGQTVPIGTDILIDLPDIPNGRIGIEICEDGWMPIPPSAFHTLNGATIIVNLSASDDLVAKADYRRSMISARSADQMGAYLYCSAGWGESSKDVLYGGDAFICENGYVIADSERFGMTSKLVVADIDLSNLAFDRRRSGSWAQGAEHHHREYRLASCRVQPLGLSLLEKKIFRPINPAPFVPSDPATLDKRCREIVAIQATALARRLSKVGDIIHRQVSIGVSGGLDSTLALLITVRAFRLLGWSLDGIIAVTMPGFGTGGRTRNNAEKLCENLGINLREIVITRTAETQLHAIGHEPCGNCLVCENVQARIRTVTLMALGFMINTGDLSEIALGWCTYAGDQTGMYGVNVGVPKTLVKFLVRHLAGTGEFGDATKAVLYDILETPISPELTRVRQHTEDLVGPYELHDFTLYHFLRWGASPEKILFLAQIAFREKYEPAVIARWLTRFFERFFNNQFKRDTNPDGVKVGSVCLGQRGDWRMPSDTGGDLWIEDARKAEKDIKP